MLEAQNAESKVLCVSHMVLVYKTPSSPAAYYLCFKKDISGVLRKGEF